MTDKENVIQFIDITKSYKMGDGIFQALKGLSFEVHKNDLFGIVGPSGSGKTSLMNLIGLLDTATSGHYFLNGQDVTSLSTRQRATLRNHHIGFIFQSFFLLPRLNAVQNVMLPLLYRGMDREQAHEKSIKMLEKVGMGARTTHRPNQLSGGQQQRVAIARALVGDPALVLADEPTGALDQATGHEVLNLLKKLNKEDGATVIIVTHDLVIANECHRKISILDGVIKEKDGWI